MVVHDVKCWSEPFNAVVSGVKKFEWRLNDRDYRVDDVIVLNEWNPDTDKYSGRYIRKRITYVLTEGFGLPDGYCVLSLDEVC